MNKTRILLVDDHEVVRLGLTTLLNDQPNLEVVGEAGTGAEALRGVEQLHPDIVLMDIRVPGEDGIEVTRKIIERSPQTKVIMLTSFGDDDLVVRSIRAGAAGYVLKQVGNTELLRAIEAVGRGEVVLDSSMTLRMLELVGDQAHEAPPDPFRGLPERELEVLAELARGKTNVEIAATLALSEKTVRNYISALRDKLHQNSRVELALYAKEYRIFERVGSK